MAKFDWNDLQAFLALARIGRLTVAAQQMGIDHSTLSRRITALEAAMGVPLFERRTEGFVLTPEGLRLSEDAEAIEALTLRMRSRLEDGSAGLSGTVRIGTPEGFGTYFLAPRITSLCESYSELEIELVANPRAFSLTKREADLAVGMGPPPDGRVYARKLVDYTLGLFASRAYCEANAPILSRNDLENNRWVGYVEDLMWTSELNYFPHIASRISRPLHISNVISQMSAVLGGAGIGVLPHYMARTEADLVCILPDSIKFTRAYWLITHADTRDFARVKLVVAFLDEALRKEGPSFWLDSR